MTKVYPNTAVEARKLGSDGSASTLTVWKKSLLFNCSGFTVYGGKGNLVFRVDKYLSDNKGEIVLMDSCGKSLLTVIRKKLSLGENWLVFDGEVNGGASIPRFSVKKHTKFLNSKVLAHVFSGCSKVGMYDIEGSYTQRCCTIYDKKRKPVAEIKKKEAAAAGIAFGNDVFQLIVQPEFDTPVAMALVILLDQMYSSRWSTQS